MLGLLTSTSTLRMALSVTDTNVQTTSSFIGSAYPQPSYVSLHLIVSVKFAHNSLNSKVAKIASAPRCRLFHRSSYFQIAGLSQVITELQFLFRFVAAPA